MSDTRFRLCSCCETGIGKIGWRCVKCNSILTENDRVYAGENLQSIEASPLQSQVGGDHYRKLAIQPAEYTTRNGLGHLAGDTIAYVTRYKDKGGKQDLEKAIHCLQLLIAIEYPDTTEKP